MVLEDELDNLGSRVRESCSNPQLEAVCEGKQQLNIHSEVGFGAFLMKYLYLSQL